MWRVFAPAAIGALVGGVASAGMTITFAEPTPVGIGPNHEFEYTADPLGGGGSLSYVGEQVELIVSDSDGTLDNITFPTFTETVEFFFEGGVSNVQSFPLGPGLSIVNGTVDADFGWRRVSDGETVISGTFLNGSVTLTPGGFNIAANAANSGLSYFLNNAILGLDPGVVFDEDGGTGDANWTLTGAQFASGGPTIVAGNQQTIFNDFIANSAFSGTITLIPSPGTGVLLAIAGMFAVRRGKN